MHAEYLGDWSRMSCIFIVYNYVELTGCLCSCAAGAHRKEIELVVTYAHINSRLGLVPLLLSMHYLPGTEWQAVCSRVGYLSLTL